MSQNFEKQATIPSTESKTANTLKGEPTENTVELESSKLDPSKNETNHSKIESQVGEDPDMMLNSIFQRMNLRQKSLPMPEDFKSYEELKNHTVGLIKSIGICESLKKIKPTEYAYFRALLQRHPDAERKKVSLITDIYFRLFPKVSRNKRLLDAKDYQIMIVTSDGEEDSISWVKSMRSEDYSVEKKLTQALRFSIESQTAEFRNNNRNVPCQLCGSVRNLSVDHINHFEGLVYNFLQLQPNHPVLFDKNKRTAQEIFRVEDSAYDSLWKEYHSNNANLQMLCVPCNQSRPSWEPPVILPEKRWKPKEER
jgi:5-methylcytosine-specific restriction endonuclease McrA